jgi:hypothetical protein
MLRQDEGGGLKHRRPAQVANDVQTLTFCRNTLYRLNAKRGVSREGSMSKEELAKFLAAVEQVHESIMASPEAAREFLQKAGYLNEDGSIADHYKSAQSYRGD